MKSAIIASWVALFVCAPIGIVLVCATTVAFYFKRVINPLKEEEGV